MASSLSLLTCAWEKDLSLIHTQTHLYAPCIDTDGRCVLAWSIHSIHIHTTLLRILLYLSQQIALNYLRYKKSLLRIEFRMLHQEDNVQLNILIFVLPQLYNFKDHGKHWHKYLRKYILYYYNITTTIKVNNYTIITYSICYYQV